MKEKKLSHWIGKMPSLAYIILKAGFIISCILLSLSLLLYTVGGGLALDNYSNYLLAKEIALLPVSILFISIIGAVCLDDLSNK